MLKGWYYLSLIDDYILLFTGTSHHRILHDPFSHIIIVFLIISLYFRIGSIHLLFFIYIC